jgi:hypothetical protein
MSLKRETISWLLVVLLGSIIALQYHGASKAEQRAAQAEAVARDTDAKLQQFEAQSEARLKQAESQYQAAMAESAALRAILAKGSQGAPQKPLPSHQEAPGDVLQAAKGSTSPAPAASACEPFIYQGQPFSIETFQVLVCDQKPMVQAEAAVALHDELAKSAKLTTELAETTAKLALEDKDLAQYKAAEQAWKKSAKKSRIKKVLGVAEKVGLFVGGIYLGHKF